MCLEPLMEYNISCFNLKPSKVTRFFITARKNECRIGVCVYMPTQGGGPNYLPRLHVRWLIDLQYATHALVRKCCEVTSVEFSAIRVQVHQALMHGPCKILYARLGDSEKALQALERAYKERQIHMTEIGVEPARCTSV